MSSSDFVESVVVGLDELTALTGALRAHGAQVRVEVRDTSATVYIRADGEAADWASVILTHLFFGGDCSIFD
jgi:hypothetical protein